MENSSNNSALDTTVELPLEEVIAALRDVEARVDNPGIGSPTPGQGTGAPEIENPTETEADPAKSDTGPSSRGATWN